VKNKHRPSTAKELSNLMQNSFAFPKGDTNKRDTHVSTDEQLDLSSL